MDEALKERQAVADYLRELACGDTFNRGLLVVLSTEIARGTHYLYLDAVREDNQRERALQHLIVRE